MFAHDFIGQLVGGDLQDGLASLHLIAFLFQPLRDGALFHGQPQLGHQYFICHVSFLLTCSARA